MFKLKGESSQVYKTITYFDTQLSVPYGTQFVATDKDGAVYAFSNMPEANANCWRGYGETLVAYYEYEGDWRESLYQIPFRDLENT